MKKNLGKRSSRVLKNRLTERAMDVVLNELTHEDHGIQFPTFPIEDREFDEAAFLAALLAVGKPYLDAQRGKSGSIIHRIEYLENLAVFVEQYFDELDITFLQFSRAYDHWWTKQASKVTRRVTPLSTER